MAIYDFDGHEKIDGVDFTGKWRYIDGLPFSASQLQNAVTTFDNYLVVVGENADKIKKVYYFDFDNEKWFDEDGEIPSTNYQVDQNSNGNNLLGKIISI